MRIFHFHHFSENYLLWEKSNHLELLKSIFLQCHQCDTTVFSSGSASSLCPYGTFHISVAIGYTELCLCWTGRRTCSALQSWTLPHCRWRLWVRFAWLCFWQRTCTIVNYVIEITFITSIPQSKQFLSTQNKALVPRLHFILRFPWDLRPALVDSLSFFLPDITDTSPTAEGNKEEAWPARKDITMHSAQIKNTFSLSSTRLVFTQHQLCAPHWTRPWRSHQKVSVLFPVPRGHTLPQKGENDCISANFQEVTDNKHFRLLEPTGKPNKIFSGILWMTSKLYLWALKF